MFEHFFVCLICLVYLYMLSAFVLAVLLPSGRYTGVFVAADICINMISEIQILVVCLLFMMFVRVGGRQKGNLSCCGYANTRITRYTEYFLESSGDNFVKC